jgi:hypothetical protein
MTIADRAALEATLQTYFDGLYEGDADKLASVFHPASSLTWEVDGERRELSLPDWLAMVRNRPSGKASGLARDDAILLLDQSGPGTAFAKVKCQLPPRYFTDYLNLLKVDGRWQVVQKIYAVQTRG